MRRLPDLRARPLGAQALSDLLDRKPQLLRPLAAQFLPRPSAAADPAARLGIDLSARQTLDDLWRMLSAVVAAIAAGEITPAEGVRIARRAGARLRSADRRVGGRFGGHSSQGRRAAGPSAGRPKA